MVALPLSLKPNHIKRYKDVAQLLLKFGHSAALKNAGLLDLLGQTVPNDGTALTQPGIIVASPISETIDESQVNEFSKELEKLGPTFVELGKLLAARNDMLPEELRKIVLAETDYRLELQNLRVLRENLKELDLIVVPETFDHHSTSRVLTMQFIDGKSVEKTDLIGYLRAERARLAQQLVYAYIKQIFIDGFVHADAKSENILLTIDGKIGWLGLGIGVHISPATQDKLLQLCLAFNDGRIEPAADLVISIGEQQAEFNESAFRHAAAEAMLKNRGKRMISGFQKIANRITVGLVLAALIIGASMLMNIHTSFTIFGYPGLAIVCFMLATGCGFSLVLEILISDHRRR
ncbi:MAG TPA: AarF/UbiB family protein [Oculatellaceae cyanobacterium]